MSRWLLFLAVLLCVCSACADHDAAPTPPLPDTALSDTRPVDMLYHATVTQIENDCIRGTKDPASSSAEVSAFLSSDGTLTLHFDGTYVPGPAYYQKVVRTGSRVNATKEEFDNIKFVHSINGVLDPDHVDLVVKGQFHNWNDVTKKDIACTKKVKLEGRARPLLDPSAIDGYYKVNTTDAFACPGKKDEMLGSAIMSLEINDDPAKSQIIFDLNGVLFSILRKDASRLDSGAEQSMYSVTDQAQKQRLGTVGGTMRPEAIDLVIKYRPEDSPDPCTELITVKGSKLIPSLSSIENRYRVKYSRTYDCVDVSFAGEPPYEDEGANEIMNTSEGVLLNEFGMTTLLTMKGDSFSADVPFIDGGLITYKGTLKPGEFSYHVTAKDAEGPHACTAEIVAIATPRFVFP